MRLLASLLAVAAVLMLGGCGGNQNVLGPASHPEQRITTLFWVMMGAAWFGFGVIVVLLAMGWFRRHRDMLPFGGGERAATVAVVGLGVAIPIAVLVALFIWSDIFVMRTTAAPSRRSTAMTIKVIGHQWFWEVRYPGTDAVTANEIHIPVRTRVDLVGTTADVIHSFWVPELNRKIDLIPGRVNRMLLEADVPGVYRGQCAEFCGLQHAHMSVLVVAQPKARFQAWLRNMAAPAPKPRTALARKGEQTFAALPCASCHTIRGTAAQGTVGPDLTHLASRSTLAAVTIPNRKGYLGGWIMDPQHVKPGNKMPGLAMTGPQLQSLLAYLDGLK